MGDSGLELVCVCCGFPLFVALLDNGRGVVFVCASANLPERTMSAIPKPTITHIFIGVWGVWANQPFPRKTGHGSLGLRQENYEPRQWLQREQTEERLYRGV